MVVCGVSALKSWQLYESARYGWALLVIGPLTVKTGSASNVCKEKPGGGGEAVQ